MGALESPESPITVFAPTNEAFESAIAALNTTAEELLADTATLMDVSRQPDGKFSHACTW